MTHHQLYRHFDKNGVLLYVGISLSAIGRLSQHKQRSDWFSKIEYVKIKNFRTRKELHAAERIAISFEKPLYNISLNKQFLSLPTKQHLQTRLINNLEQIQRNSREGIVYSIFSVSRMFNISSYILRQMKKSGELSPGAGIKATDLERIALEAVKPTRSKRSKPFIDEQLMLPL